MRTIRLLWPPNADGKTGDDVFLSPDQARHGALVLRLSVGDEVEMLAPVGLAPAKVSRVLTSGPYSRKNPGLAVRLTGPWRREAAEGPRLALALIQGPRFDWAVEKAVELGASGLIPIITERTKAANVKPGAGRAERWARLAEEARKQCGRSRSLEILAPHSLPQLAALPGPGFFLSLSADAAPPINSVSTIAGDSGPGASAALRESASPLVAVGPEGGFTEEEERFFLNAGFIPISLGPTVLRAETAALAVLALLLKTGRDA